jgi:hypothetical protein
MTTIVHTIGCQAEADIARSMVNDPSNGWSRVGSGSMRYVVLSPSGVVYKVHRYIEVNSNQIEFDNSLRLADFNDGFRFAKCDLYTVDDEYVIAMEYIDGCFPDNDEATEIAIVAAELGVYDIFYKNILCPLDGSIPVIIDMGE